MKAGTQNFDAVVIGAGVAGSATAIRLAAAGRRVALVDRETGPTHKVCGEFLSGPTVWHLRALGVDPAALGGRRVETLRLASGARLVEVPLPFEAWGLSRFRLDTALRERARAAGASLMMGRTVRRFAEGRIVLSDGDVLTADRIVLATGKHDLAGRRRPVADPRRMVGFKLHLRLTEQQTAALGRNVELFFFEGGYAGLQAVEDGIANLSLVIAEARFAAAGRDFAGVIAAAAPPGGALALRLDGHRPLWPKPLAVAGVPYGFRLWREPPGPDWLWPVGDQAAVIPSFTGDGMAIALASAERAATAMLEGEPVSAYRKAIRSDAARPLAIAQALDALTSMPRLRHLSLAAVSFAPTLAMLAARATRVPPPAAAA
jgi:flavin-dependent dehydrogenase